MAEDWQRGGFGVYVHWPFCAAKCPYCDFNSHVRAGIDQDRWRRALVAEIGTVAAGLPGRRVDSVFFGGGTPSLMPPETVAAVVAEIGAVWRMNQGAEITLEANPTSVEAGRFRAYAAAGVNRVSIGVQALNDADLRALGRMHSVAEARRAFEIARDNFARVSFDLIYARQNQTLADWEAELRAALAMAVDHLSLYQLTIEPGTRFGDLAAHGRLRGLPGGGLAADLYLATQEICGTAGLGGYEVSNHARSGAQGRHNLIYWHYGDYVGVGPGAHGRLTQGGVRRATEAWREPDAWLAAVEASGCGTRNCAAIGAEEQATEFLMMGLRLAEGIEIARFATLAGRTLPTAAITELQDLGLVEAENDRLRATCTGRPVLNAVLGRLLEREPTA